MNKPTFSEDERKFLHALQAEVNETSEANKNHVYDKTEGETGPTDGEAPGGGFCTYVNYRDGGETPSCLIGRALVRSGLMTVEDLKRHEGMAACIVVPMDEGSRVANAATRMQSKQDEGYTWEYAYTHGLLYLANGGYDVVSFMLD